MKRLLPLLIFLLICSFAQTSSARMSTAIASGSVASAAASCGSCQGAATCSSVALGCSYRETFEGATECVSGGDTNCDLAWTITAGTVDFNVTDNVLQGTYSASITGSGSLMRTGSMTAADEYYVASYVYLSGRPGSKQILLMLTNSYNTRCTMYVSSGGDVTTQSVGGTDSATIATINTGGYYFKLRGKKGTGANAECQGWVSADGIDWGTPQSSTDGTWTDQLDRRYVGNGSATPTYYFDDIRTHTGDISW